MKRPDVMIRFADGVFDFPTKSQCEIVSVLSLVPYKSPTDHPDGEVVRLIRDLMLHGY